MSCLSVNNDTANMVGFAESHVFPGFATVRGLIDSIPQDGLCRLFASPFQPTRYSIVRIDGDVTDRDSRLAVEDVLPCVPVIRGLQQSARRGRHIEDAGVRFVHRHIGNTAGHDGWSDITRLERVQKRFRELSGCRRAEEDDSTQ